MVNVLSTKTTQALVDVEIFDPKGVRVGSQVWDRQSFTAGRTKSFSFWWSVPPNAPKGTYTIRVGTFSNGWGTLYHWNNNATTFVVQ